MCHHASMRQENATWEISQAVERRPGQILERHDLAEDITRQANLHGYSMLMPSPNHGTLRLPNDDDDDFCLARSAVSGDSDQYASSTTEPSV